MPERKPYRLPSPVTGPPRCDAFPRQAKHKSGPPGLYGRPGRGHCGRTASRRNRRHHWKQHARRDHRRYDGGRLPVCRWVKRLKVRANMARSTRVGAEASRVRLCLFANRSRETETDELALPRPSILNITLPLREDGILEPAEVFDGTSKRRVWRGRRISSSFRQSMSSSRTTLACSR